MVKFCLGDRTSFKIIYSNLVYCDTELVAKIAGKERL